MSSPRLANDPIITLRAKALSFVEAKSTLITTTFYQNEPVRIGSKLVDTTSLMQILTSLFAGLRYKLIPAKDVYDFLFDSYESKKSIFNLVQYAMSRYHCHGKAKTEQDNLKIIADFDKMLFGLVNQLLENKELCTDITQALSEHTGWVAPGYHERERDFIFPCLSKCVAQVPALGKKIDVSYISVLSDSDKSRGKFIIEGNRLLKSVEYGIREENISYLESILDYLETLEKHRCHDQVMNALGVTAQEGQRKLLDCFFDKSVSSSFRISMVAALFARKINLPNDVVATFASFKDDVCNRHADRYFDNKKAGLIELANDKKSSLNRLLNQPNGWLQLLNRSGDDRIKSYQGLPTKTQRFSCGFGGS